MSHSRSNNKISDSYLPYSGFRTLLSCKSDNIDQTIMAKIISDPSIMPDNHLEYEFAALGRRKSLDTLWKKGTTNLKEHYHPALGLRAAIRYNHPDLAYFYLDTFAKQNIEYTLFDGKTPASTHKAAYIGKPASLKVLRIMAADPERQKTLDNIINTLDQFGNLPLHNAIAGGHEDFVQFFLEHTLPELYDLTDLVVRAFESRNSKLAPLFINEIANNFMKFSDSYFKRYGTFDEYIIYICKIATLHCKNNPGNDIAELLASIANQEYKNSWISRFRELALANGFSNIFSALALAVTLDDDASQIETISELFIFAENFPLETINLSKLVVQSYLPILKSSPKLVYDILEYILEDIPDEKTNDNEYKEDNKTSARHLMHYIPKEIKEAASKAGVDKNILRYLSMTTKTELSTAQTATHKLFEASKNDGNHSLKSILEMYINYFEKNEATPTTYLCAAHVAFLEKKYGLARKWYQEGLKTYASNNDGVIVTAYQILATQLLIIFEDLDINLPAHFVETCTKNLSSLIDIDSFNFTLAFNAVLFIPDNIKTTISFKKLYDNLHEIDTTLPLYDQTKAKAESWNLLYTLKQTSFHLYNLFTKLTKQYGISFELVKPDAESIETAKETLALNMLRRNSTELYTRLANVLGKTMDTPTDITHIDLTMQLLTNAIKKESAELAKKTIKKEKVKEITEKNRQANLTTKAIQNKLRKNTSSTEKVKVEPANISSKFTPTKDINEHVNAPAVSHQLTLQKLAAENKREKEIQLAIEAEEKEAATARERLEADKKAAAAIKAKREAEERSLAEARAKLEAEHKTVAEARAKLETEYKAAADARIKLEAEHKATAETRIKLEAEHKRAGDARTKLEAEHKATAEARVRLEAEHKATADARVKLEAEHKATADVRVKLEAEHKAVADARAELEADLQAMKERKSNTISSDYDYEIRSPATSSNTQLNHGHQVNSTKMQPEHVFGALFIPMSNPIPIMSQHIQTLQQQLAFSQQQYQHAQQLQQEQKKSHESRIHLIHIQYQQMQHEFQARHEQDMQQLLDINIALKKQLEEQTLSSQELRLQQQDFSRQLKLMRKALIPQNQFMPNQSITMRAAQFGISSSVANFLVKYEGRIFITGGANRDYCWNVKPKDIDLVFFGTLSELQHNFPDLEYIKQPTESFASFYINGEKVDLLIKQCGTREQNLKSLEDDIDSRDLTMNATYREITANGSSLIGKGQSKDDIKNCHFDLATDLFGSRNFMLHAPRYFRFIFLKHKAIDLTMTPTYSQLLLDNITELKTNKNEFLTNCSAKSNRENIRRIFDDQIVNDKGRTYRILLDEGIDQLVVDAGIFTTNEMESLKQVFIDARNKLTTVSRSISTSEFSHFANHTQDALTDNENKPTTPQL